MTLDRSISSVGISRQQYYANAKAALEASHSAYRRGDYDQAQSYAKRASELVLKAGNVSR